MTYKKTISFKITKLANLTSRTIIEQEVDPMLVNINHEKFVTLRRTNPDKKKYVFCVLPETMNASPSRRYTMPKIIKRRRWGSSLKSTTARRITWSDTTILTWGGRPTPRHFENAATSLLVSLHLRHIKDTGSVPVKYPYNTNPKTKSRWLPNEFTCQHGPLDLETSNTTFYRPSSRHVEAMRKSIQK